MSILRSVVLLMLVLHAGVAQAQKSDVVQRLERSLAVGTGGEIAKFLLCNADAVLFFADGHQTPELISDWRAWEELLWWETPGSFLEAQPIALPAALSRDSVAEIESSKKPVQQYIEQFNRENWRYARMIDGAPEDEAQRIRIAAYNLSNKANEEISILAKKSLASIERELGPDQWKVFVDWLQRAKKDLVVGRFDHSKVRIYKLDRC